MSETKTCRRFYLPLLLICIMLGLVLALPQLPQSDLRTRLVDEFSQVLQHPCQVHKVNLQVFPRPAIVVHGFTANVAEFSLKVATLNLDFSLSSFFALAPEVVGVHLRGVVMKTPFVSLSASDTGSVAGQHIGSAPVSLVSVNSAIRMQAPQLQYLNLHDAACTLTKIPGLNDPLLFSELDGSWQISSHNSSESLNLSGACNGGRGALKVTWYEISGSTDDNLEKSLNQVGDRLDISCKLDDISLPSYEMAALFGANVSWKASVVKGDLEFDVNGDPGAGLRFSGKFAAADHSVAMYDAILDTEKIYSQGAIKVALAGFFQRRDGYVNIKSAALEYPGAATLFSRGLVRFDEPIFVDLVNDLKVEDLNLLSRRLPGLVVPGYQTEGQLAGELKLVGNPLAAPVLQVKLKSDKIVLQRDGSSTPLLENSLAPDVSAMADSSPALDFRDRFAKMLRAVAKWECLIRSDCWIGTLVLPQLTISDVSLLAEKSLVQVEVERLVAHFGNSGQLRLSLFIENLLHDSHWQASLIAEKFDLKPFSKTLMLNGILDASLVGGGLLDSDSELIADLTLSGKWRLRNGVFNNSPLFNTFLHFLEEQERGRFALGFSDFAGKFGLRDRVLRFDHLKLISAGNLVNAGGRFFIDRKRLKFSGQFLAESFPPLSFILVGDSANPSFQLQYLGDD